MLHVAGGAHASPSSGVRSPVMRALPVMLLAVALAACGGGRDVRDANVDARVLECAAPLTHVLSPSTRPPNVGLPTVSITWSGDGCALHDDEGHPDAVLFVADTAGTWFDVGLLAQADSRWFIAESSTGTMRATYIPGIPPATDIHLVLETDGTRVSVDFRVDGDTLTLLAMREL